MRRGTRAGGVVALALSASLMLVAPTAAARSEAATVRFLHAVPGGGSAELRAAEVEVGRAGYREATAPVEVPPGQVELELAGADGQVASAREALEAGESYTAVALWRDVEESLELRLFRDEGAPGGRASVRAIHAAPELGEPDVRVGDRMIAERLTYMEGTGYRSLAPGTYAVVAEDPASGRVVVEEPGVALTAGTASTAVVVGTRGQAVDVVLLEDGSAAPSEPPATGLGGLAGDRGPSWPLVLAAALLCGALGGGGYRLARRRAGPRRT